VHGVVLSLNTGQGPYRKIAMQMAVYATSILIVDDAQEMRDGLEALLRRDGYLVSSARDESEAIELIRGNVPSLILFSLAGTTEYMLNTARRIRFLGGLDVSTPVVIFSITNFREGVEEHVGDNIVVTAPDNFDQLRMLLIRLLRKS
jgi:DNA-binding response OmpR family regulator